MNENDVLLMNDTSFSFIHQAGNIPSHLFHIPHVGHLNPSSMQDVCHMNLV